MKRNLFQAMIVIALVTMLLGLAPTGTVQAAAYRNWVAQVPAIPTASETVRIWMNSDTVYGETAGVEYLIGSVYVKVLGHYDNTGYPGANWYADIPAQPDGTLVEYKLFTRNEFGSDYGFTGFNWRYTVLNVYVDDNYSSATPGWNVDHFDTIQAGINAVPAGGTVNVAAGTYVENVLVNKPVTIAGESQTGVIVIPAISMPNCGDGSLCAGASNVFLVQANDVTIHDLTVDGDNPALISGIVRGGADLDARNGIITNHPAGVWNNLVIYNTTVKNIYLRGIYASSGGTFNIHHNTVTNVRGELASIAIMNFYGAGIFDSNTVSEANDGVVSNWSSGTTYSNNTVTQSGSGIHTDNAGSLSGSVADIITGNTISNCDPNGYGIWTYATYIAPSSIQNNTITNCTVGMAAFGSRNENPVVFSNNVINGGNLANSIGFVSSTSIAPYGSLNIVADFSNNQVTNAIYGVVIEAETGYTNTSSITGNTITNTSGSTFTAIQVENGTATVTGNTLTGVSFLKGNGLVLNNGLLTAEGNVISKYAQGATVNGGTAVIGGNVWTEHNTFASTGYGFSVTNGVLTVKGNTISSTVPFYQEAGTLTAYANNIAAVAIGLETSGGTTSLKHNYWGSNDPLAAMPEGLTAADWNARLGAPISDWAEGSSSVTLRDAELIGAGTLQIVYHGDGSSEASRPFNNGVLGYASNMCSDFFDVFAVNGSDTYTIKLPVDARTDCDTTFAKGALGWIPAGSDYATTCAEDNPNCWDGVKHNTGLTVVQESGTPRKLSVSGVSAAQIGGTQFVVADPFGNDPTAIELVSLQATSRGSGAGWLFSLLGAGGLLGALLITRRKK